MTDSDTLKIAKWMPGLFWLFPVWAFRSDVLVPSTGYTILHAAWSGMQIIFGLWYCGMLN